MSAASSSVYCSVELTVPYPLMSMFNGRRLVSVVVVLMFSAPLA